MAIRFKENRISRNELDIILEQHRAWILSDGTQGQQAKLQNALIETKVLKGDLRGIELDNCSFDSGIVDGTKEGVWLDGADLRNSNLQHTNLSGSFIRDVNFSGANIHNVNLSFSDLIKVNFKEANLWKVDLSGSTIIETSFQRANLTESYVYGISAWDIETESAKQKDLIITPQGNPTVTVDEIEVAQFIYLVRNNRKIRNVIDTITSKAVLILGRFKDDRKQILDTIRDRLRALNYVPILFDFEPSNKRDLTETVQLLANMSKFVIADITEAKSIPQELSHIVPMLPSVPIQPILLAEDFSYAMFEHWKGFDSVLPVFRYKNEQHLIHHLDDKVIVPAKDWRSKQDDIFTLKKRIKELEFQLMKNE